MQHLASKLTKVSEEDREQLSERPRKWRCAALKAPDGATVNTQQAPSSQRRTVMRPSSSGR